MRRQICILVCLVLCGCVDRSNRAERPSPVPDLVSCNGLIATIQGTPGDDQIVGTQEADVIHGLGGNDSIIALGGDDVVCGGDGEDVIDLGSGDDIAFGGKHSDTISGGDHDDRIYGQGGEDIIRCRGGNDYANGGIGNDSFLENVNDCETVISIGYRIHDAPLNSDAQYSQVFDEEGTLARDFIVAGCVPLDHPVDVGFESSSWVACNDLSMVSDDVVESSFVACGDLVQNGVVRSMSITEFRNRKWTQFSFSCSPLNSATGALDVDEFGSGRLFDFENEGTEYTSATEDEYLPTAIWEKYNQLELNSKRLLGVRFITNSVNPNEDGLDYSFDNVTPDIPQTNPALIGLHTWTCPEDTALTGMAIGHKPKSDNSYTRPIYLLGECRRVIRE